MGSDPASGQSRSRLARQETWTVRAASGIMSGIVSGMMPDTMPDTMPDMMPDMMPDNTRYSTTRPSIPPARSRRK